MGEAIAMGIERGEWVRESLVITTKLFFGTIPGGNHNTKGLSRKHIIEGARASVKRMGLEVRIALGAFMCVCVFDA